MIYDWKSLGIWLNSMWRAQIEGLYIVRYVTQGCTEWVLLGLCLSSPAHDMDFVCVCSWKEAESCTFPSFVLLPQEHGEKAVPVLQGPWGPVFAAFPTVILIHPLPDVRWLFPWSREEQHFICEEFRRISFPVSPADRDNRVLIFVAS